ncbi:hypothetical protein PLICRDRAFT_26327 [Plicaturopsis crispa FD-325 SS-3]|nr:hypothetical protein PLICRDRAFT_26327 [Plicaturopsis crispa FD-325 SS-3]
MPADNSNISSNSANLRAESPVSVTYPAIDSDAAAAISSMEHFSPFALAFEELKIATMASPIGSLVLLENSVATSALWTLQHLARTIVEAGTRHQSYLDMESTSSVPSYMFASLGMPPPRVLQLLQVDPEFNTLRGSYPRAVMKRTWQNVAEIGREAQAWIVEAMQRSRGITTRTPWLWRYMLTDEDDAGNVRLKADDFAATAKVTTAVRLVAPPLVSTLDDFPVPASATIAAAVNLREPTPVNIVNASSFAAHAVATPVEFEDAYIIPVHSVPAFADVIDVDLFDGVFSDDEATTDSAKEKEVFGGSSSELSSDEDDTPLSDDAAHASRVHAYRVAAVAEEPCRALVLHPTKSRYARAHPEFSPWATGTTARTTEESSDEEEMEM